MSTMPPSRYKFYAHVAGNTSYLILALAATCGTLFGFDVFLGRFLTKPDLDLVTYIVSLASICLMLSDLGLSQSVSSQVAGALATGDTTRANRIISNALTLQLLSALFFGGLLLAASFVMSAPKEELSPGVFAAIIPDDEFRPLLRIMALWLVTLPFVRLFSAIFEGHQKMAYSFVAALFREPIRLTLLVPVFLYFRKGPGTVIMVFAWSSILVLLASLTLFKVFRQRTPALNIRLSTTGSRELFSTSLYYFLPLVSLLVFPDLVKVVTENLAPPGTLARLRICIGFSSVAFVILGALPRALLPAFSSRTKDLAVLRATFLGLMKYAGFANLLVFVFLTGVGPYLIPLIFGKQYPVEEVRQLLVLVSLGSFFDVYRLLCDPALQGTGHFRVIGIVETIRIVAFVGLAFLLIPRWPILGVGVAFSSVALVAWLQRLFWVHRLVAFVPWRSLMATAVLVIGITLAAAWQQTLLFWVLVAVALILQVARFSRTEIETIRQTVKAFLVKR